VAGERTEQPRRRGRPPGSSGDELLETARQEFLAHGYAGTTMDALAGRARISKNSLYREYPSKERLFAAVVADWVRRGRDAMRPHLDALVEADDVRSGLQHFARVLQAAVLSPAVLRIRTLISAEAARFPEVAAGYVTDSWEANLRAFGDTLAVLMERGSIGRGDPALAAEQFTWLVLAAPLNRLTLEAGLESYPPARLERIADEAVETFLARFAPSADPVGRPQER
jgi:TetR/AcrR family transcriptional repressor of mexJK operon